MPSVIFVRRGVVGSSILVEFLDHLLDRGAICPLGILDQFVSLFLVALDHRRHGVLGHLPHRLVPFVLALDMAYMDVPAETPGGATAVLLHGKNFCAATWQATITELTKAGYRVIAPDQVGFCKSTKPERYQYSFQQLADTTHALLTSLGIAKPAIIGHSTGGMLAIRYGLMHPAEVSQLVLVNPIGLEDWKTAGIPWQSIDAW